MSTHQKILTIVLWTIVGAGVFALAALYRLSHENAAVAQAPTTAANENDEAMPTLFQAPVFELIDQDGSKFTDAQLKGFESIQRKLALAGNPYRWTPFVK